MSLFGRQGVEEEEPQVKQESEDEASVQMDISITIPDVLKKKLEDDCFYVNKRKRVRTRPLPPQWATPP